MSTENRSAKMVRNDPTPEGAALGREMARLADLAIADLSAKFPNIRERCKTCALRSGTIPNQSPFTLMDVLKCVLEQDNPFYCHEDKTKLCAGYGALLDPNKAPVKVDWEYSL